MDHPNDADQQNRLLAYDIVALPDIEPQGVVNNYLPIPTWLQTRLENQFSDQDYAPLEYSLYGPLDALLWSQFPLERKFLVKPQATLRMSTAAVQDTHAHRYIRRPRNTSGGSTSFRDSFFPDFVVVRAHEQLSNDWILCIIEVKREGEKLSSCKPQIEGYLIRAANETFKVGIIHGFLVIGSVWYAYQINTQNAKPVPVRIRNDPFLHGSTAGDGLKQMLFRIAKKYWGDAEAEWKDPNYIGHYEHM